MPENKRKASGDSPAPKRRRVPDAEGPASPVPLPATPVVPSMFEYTPDAADYKQPKDQVKYGPGEGLSEEDQRLAHAKIHPGADAPAPGSRAMKDSPVFSRLTQYSPAHDTYLRHAHRTERPLTLQEQSALETGENAEHASINHVIASGVGQNTLNQGLANFSRGESAMPAGPASSSETDVAAYQQGVRSSLASQAAAVGRVQMYNRAIAFENLTPDQKQASLARGSTPTGSAEPAHDVERNALLKQTIGVMEDGGLEGYRGLLKSTFDSPANLRVGHDRINGVVSTGLDVELDTNADPTARSQRLQAAHLAAAPDHDTRIWTTFQGSGNALSSSMEATGTPAPDPDTAVRAAKPKKRRGKKSD